MNTNAIILSGVHVELTDSLKNKVYEQVERLFVHEPRILRVRVELLCEKHARTHKEEFIAKGHVEMKGNTFFVAARNDNLYTAIGLLAQKLDRKLRRYNRRRETDRKKVQPVEFSIDIPNVIA